MQPKPKKKLSRLGRVARLSRYWSTVVWNLLPPGRSRSIFVLGHPRTGTNWMCRMMSLYFDLPTHQVGTQPLPRFDPVVLHLHRFVIVPERTVYVMRDPRDVMVSYYHKSVNSLPRMHRPTLALLESFCPKPVAHENVRENLAGFIRFLFQANKRSSIDYVRHVREAHRRGLHCVRYEDLIENGEQALTAVVEFIGKAPADPERVRRTLEETSFERKTGRARGVEDLSGASVRKGIVGDWTNQFTTESARLLDSFAGDVLVDCGYAPDRSWVDRVPAS